LGKHGIEQDTQGSRQESARVHWGAFNTAKANLHRAMKTQNPPDYSQPTLEL
jgi:hypothetical protein